MNNSDKQEFGVRDGGPAFPQGPEWGSNKVVPTGMSFRDYFAGMALQGVLSEGFTPNHQIAKEAYLIADLMLTQREKKEGE